jgi:hypothetical protein
MTYKSFLFFRRVFRWSIWTYFCNANDLSHSLALQQTAAAMWLPGVHSFTARLLLLSYVVRWYEQHQTGNRCLGSSGWQAVVPNSQDALTYSPWRGYKSVRHRVLLGNYPRSTRGDCSAVAFRAWHRTRSYTASPRGSLTLAVVTAVFGEIFQRAHVLSRVVVSLGAV